jgi:ABC-2 type transport system permease protein
LWASGILTLLPGLFGTTILWPFAGLAIVVLASTTTANVYGMDGTSIWTTLMAPAAARSDVRARQLNWIAIFGLLGIVATLVATALSDQAWAWPWVLAALPAITGAAAGLIVLVGIVAPAPLPERRGGDPLDLGDDPRTTNAYFLQGVLLTFLSPLAAIPPLLVVAATAQTGGLVVWLGIPVGLATGVLAAWALGTVAASRLSRRGPEVLERLRARPAPVSRQRPHDRKRLPVSAWIAILIGCLALFPQSLVPALIILSGSDTRLWFLAMYLPPDLRAVGVAIMAAVGVAAFAAAWWIAMRARRAIG